LSKREGKAEGIVQSHYVWLGVIEECSFFEGSQPVPVGPSGRKVRLKKSKFLEVEKGKGLVS
jgi:hypothetical protein